MTSKVGPVAQKAYNNAGSSKPLLASGPRCADKLMMARPQQNERHKEAGHTTAAIPARLESSFVSTCAGSSYTPC
jgi:hypothetical protein